MTKGIIPVIPAFFFVIPAQAGIYKIINFMQSYNPKKIEAKWIKIWDQNKTFKVDLQNAKKPFYNLAMFPYPSGEGLHMGHIIPYSGVDTYGRFLRMNGYDVFEPMGFDAFGIHSENFAIKKGIHPKTLIAQTTTYFREKQMKRLGTLFDWDHEVNTTDPDYYQWTQWLFIQMFKAGLAEKKKAPVTYCPSCKTVLSDEQTEVKDAVTVCERCKTPIERKEMEQWFFKITKYADKLLANLDHINWSEKTKRAQRNWIGKSEGINITYDVVDESGNKLTIYNVPASAKASAGRQCTITCFTTRPDTNFGATFLVLAPEHSFVSWLLSQTSLKFPTSLTQIQAYVARSKSKSEQDRIAEGKEKTGVFTGYFAINNLNGKKIPIWISDFVLPSVGTGAVVGVPAHDERDFAFAKKFDLPIIPVVSSSVSDLSNPSDLSDLETSFLFEGDGVCINSDFLNGLSTQDAKEKVMDHLEAKGWGKRVTSFKLRDWCISRQRYWGPPIPMIFCKKCKWQPVPEKDLPVLLPFVKDYKPTGDGKSPLAKDKKWMKVKCPNCGGWAERETDVSDTFLDSAWYFLRYPSVNLKLDGRRLKVDIEDRSLRLEKNQPSSFQLQNPASTVHPLSSTSLPWDREVTRKWLPVDMYIGGNEHAVLHLMYSRFVTMALKDMGHIDFEEPFKRFFAHGLLISEGAKMSKSRGNVVNPNIYLDKYGADTLRMYILFLGPYDAGGDFRAASIAGMYRFLNRVWTLVNSSPLVRRSLGEGGNLPNHPNNPNLIIATHKTIKKVTEDIKSLHFNTAIASLMEFYNALSSDISSPNLPKNPNLPNSIWPEALKTFLLLLAPFAPFISEELWQVQELKNSRIKELKNNSSVIPASSSVIPANAGIYTNNSSIHNQPWPTYDEKLLVSENVTIIIQINGKIRDKIEISSTKSKIQKEVENLALSLPRIKSFLSLYPAKSRETESVVGRSGAKPRKTIFLPGKLINFVV